MNKYQGTKTEKNLQAAFAGESQARNKYTYYAAQAKKEGFEILTANITMKYSGRYVAENEGGDGIIKVLINKKYRNVIGVHMIGNYSSEIIYGAGVMIETEMPVKDIKKLVFPHPSVCEVIREGIFEFND